MMWNYKKARTSAERAREHDSEAREGSGARFCRSLAFRWGMVLFSLRTIKVSEGGHCDY